MKIQFIRNATMIISYGAQNIIVDPCFGPKGSLPPYTLFRRFPRFNPVVPLPKNINQELEDITAGLITHTPSNLMDHQIDHWGIQKRNGHLYDPLPKNQRSDRHHPIERDCDKNECVKKLRHRCR